MSDRHRSFLRHRSVHVVWTVIATVVWPLVPAPSRAAEPAAPTARRLPAGGLAAFLEYDGLAAHRQAWEGTAAGAIVNRTSAGAMAAELSRQLLDQLFKSVPDTKLQAADVLGVTRDLFDNGFAIAIYAQDDGTTHCVLVGSGFGRQDARRRLEKLQHDLLSDQKDAKPARTETIRGRAIHHLAFVEATENVEEKPKDAVGNDVFNPAVEAPEPVRAKPKPEGDAPAEKKAAPAAPAEPTVSYWFEGDDLFAVFSSTPGASTPRADEAPEQQRVQRAHGHKDNLAAIFDAIEGKTRNITTHEGYIAALAEGKDVKDFEGDGVFFVELDPHSGALKALFDDAKDGAGGLFTSPVQGLTLPSGRYMHDDVKYIGPAPLAAVPSVPQPPAPVPSGSLATNTLPAAVSSVPQPLAPVAGRAATVETLAVPPPAPVSPLAPPTVAQAVPNAAPSPPRDGEVVPATLSPAQKPSQKDAAPEIDELEVLGLRGLKRLIVRWGFQGKGLATIVRAEIPNPRPGALEFIDQPGFRKDALPPIPKGVTSFVIGSFEPLRSYNAAIVLAKSIEPEIGAMVDAGEQSVHEAIGLRLREDVLAHVGPTWCTFDVSDGSRNSSTGIPLGQVVVVRLRDAEAFAKVLDRAATQVNRYLKEQENGEGKDAAKGDQTLPALTLERLPAPDRGYALTSPAGLVFWLDDDVRPTVLVGKSYMVLAANPDVARAVLAAETDPAAAWRPEGELARTFADLPAELTSLSVADTADSPWPDVIAKLPAYVQLLANLIETSAADGDASPVSAVMGLVGVPRPSGFRVRLDAAKLPKANAVREHLFPSVLATTVDDRGLRWVGREAFPLAAITSTMPVKPKFKIDLTKPAGNRVKLDFEMSGVKVNTK